METGGKSQIVLIGANFVTGNDSQTGQELFRLNYLLGSNHRQRVVPTPVLGGKYLIAVKPRNGSLFALPRDIQGPHDAAAMAWTISENTPDTPSPLVYRQRLYFIQDSKGTLTCLNPDTGKPVWVGDLGKGGLFHASPTAGDGKIYCINRSGEVIVVQAGDHFKILNRISMGEAPCSSSIAIANQSPFYPDREKPLLYQVIIFYRLKYLSWIGSSFHMNHLKLISIRHSSIARFAQFAQVILLVCLLLTPALASVASAAPAPAFALEPSSDSITLVQGDLKLSVSIHCPKFVLESQTVGGDLASTSATGDVRTTGPVEIAYAPIHLKDASQLKVKLHMQWSPSEKILRKWATFRLDNATTPHAPQGSHPGRLRHLSPRPGTRPAPGDHHPASKLPRLPQGFFHRYRIPRLFDPPGIRPRGPGPHAGPANPARRQLHHPQSHLRLRPRGQRKNRLSVLHHESFPRLLQPPAHLGFLGQPPHPLHRGRTTRTHPDD